MRPLRLLNLFQKNAKRGVFQATENEIFIYDIIVGSEAEAEWWGGVSPEAFAKALQGMSGPVSVRINSPGGDAFGGRAIAQMMREYGGEIVAHIDGVAASAASIIAMAATRSVMAPGSLLMIHNAWMITMGDAADLRSQADVLEKIDQLAAETYAAKGNADAAHYRELMQAETWFTPAEAVAEGLVDEAAPETKKQDKGSKQSWDLSAFLRAPKEPEPEGALAPPPAPVEPPAPAQAATPEPDDRDRRRRQLAAIAARTA